ncbi:MAG: (2Fe-2S) ferredoxin domain-containing protein [Alphaproteobacteria bacterium]|nr:(2Fe-2S) ferredoxin domain-containing protein [Alphaproteobacteria bacterium]
MTTPFFQNHIFCCTNLRPDGHERGSCAGKGAERLRNYMKDKAKELGLPETRINSAGCLDRCELGPVIVIYPEGIWYRAQDKNDIDEILISHVQSGVPVERLILPEKRLPEKA